MDCRCDNTHSIIFTKEKILKCFRVIGVVKGEKTMNVLSLCDGISVGQLALKRAGIKFLKYFASEVNNSVIKITQFNFPRTIQLGDITKLDPKNLPKTVFLLIAGFPCQDLSRAKRRGEGLHGESSKLFWEIIRIIKLVKPKFFIIENVMMKKEWMDIISNELGVKPIIINSNLVSAQNRLRLYWTNIPGITQPDNRGILISNIIYDDLYKRFYDSRITLTKKLTKSCVKWNINGKKHFSQPHRAYYKNGKMCTITKGQDFMNIVIDYENDIYRRIHPVEAERCQTIPDNYTNVPGVSLSQRFRALGNSWTVDVITHILSFLPKKRV